MAEALHDARRMRHLRICNVFGNRTRDRPVGRATWSLATRKLALQASRLGITPQFVGKGYTYEAFVATMDFAFEVPGWSEVIHMIDPDNVRSITPAHPVGSTNGGPTLLPDPFQGARVDAWGQTAALWRSRKAQRP